MAQLTDLIDRYPFAKRCFDMYNYIYAKLDARISNLKQKRFCSSNTVSIPFAAM